MLFFYHVEQSHVNNVVFWKPDTVTGRFEEFFRYRYKIEGMFSAAKRVSGRYLWSRGTRVPANRPPNPDEVARARIA